MKVSETSTDYEKLAKKIYEDILALEGIENINVQHNIKVKGKSGVEHQIDVYWEYSYAGMNHKVLIECKHYSHNVSLLHARNLHGLITDIPNSSGVLVTTVGYQSGVEQYAGFYELGLKVIRKPKGDDWDGCIQIVNIEMNLRRNNYLDLKVDLDGNCPETVELSKENKDFLSHDLVVEEKGFKPTPLNLYLDRHIQQTKDFGEEKEVILTPEKTFLLLPNGEKLKLGRLLVKYMTSEDKRTITCDAMDLVEAVLEDYKTGKIEHMSTKE
ncbi:MAG: restriction endonuclease [Lentisphaeraceae bacterium]|nr:restriction endonuclease [Lentisphaeraceae bacterium]